MFIYIEFKSTKKQKVLYFDKQLYMTMFLILIGFSLSGFYNFIIFSFMFYFCQYVYIVLLHTEREKNSTISIWLKPLVKILLGQTKYGLCKIKHYQ